MQLIEAPMSALPSRPEEADGMPDCTAACAAPRVPTMVVGESYSVDVVPLGLGEPLQLRGGDRLERPGIAERLGCEWNAEFLRMVHDAAVLQLASGRRWFRMDPVLLAGPKGAGRTHVARRLAHEAGVPHVAICVAGGGARLALGAAASGPSPAVPSQLALAVALSGCANPLIDVSGVEDASPDTLARLATAMDPMQGRLDDEGLGVTLELSEASWLVQVAPGREPPPAMAEVAKVVALAKPDSAEWLDLAWIETLIEVAADRGLQGACAAVAEHAPVNDRSLWNGTLADAAARYRMAAATFDAAFGPA